MSPKVRFFVGAALVAIIGMILLAYATQSGPGLSPDSRGYLQAARYIQQGRGICNINGNGDVVPLTHFAPLYPILLATFGTGADPLDRARVLGILVFGINIILGGWIVYRLTGKLALAGIIGSILVAVSFDMVRVHVMVWSEPAFITFMLAGFLLISEYLNTLKLRWLICGALAIAAGFLMRYSGASLVMAVGVVVLFFPGRSFARKLLDSAIFGALSVLPMVIWIVRNIMETQDAADRAAAFHPPGWNEIQLSLITLAGWIVPLEKSAVITAIILALLAIVCIAPLLVRANFAATTDAKDQPLHVLLPCFAIVYWLFLLFSVTFVDAHTPLDYRILAPLYITLILWLAGIILPRLLIDKRTIAARVVMAILLTGFVGSHLARSAVWAKTTHAEGIGYGSKVWRDSPTLAFVKKLPWDTLLYSNSPDLIDFRVNRFAKPVPKVMNPITRKAEKTYQPYLMGLRDDLTAHGGYIVWFNIRKSSRWYLVSEEQLKKDLALEQVEKFADGTVYRLRAPATQATSNPAP